ncbi:replication protein [Citrobacter sp. wls710]|nr:replication protein [Citrobacter sp. wls710]
MHLPPQAAGPYRSRFSYNTQTQPPEKPRSRAEPKPQSPPKGRNRVAFNYECCNYTPSSLSVFSLEVLSTRS